MWAWSWLRENLERARGGAELKGLLLPPMGLSNAVLQSVKIFCTDTKPVTSNEACAEENNR